MGQEIATPESPRTSAFNSPFEIGLRCLLLLFEGRPIFADTQKLLFLDYALVHSGDFPHGPESLHPSTPARSSEFLTRRALVQSGILLMVSRGLVDVHLSNRGVLYAASDDAHAYVDNLTSDYLTQLRHRARWVTTTLGPMKTEDLARIFSDHVDRWGSEFVFMRDLSEDLSGIWQIAEQ